MLANLDQFPPLSPEQKDARTLQLEQTISALKQTVDNLRQVNMQLVKRIQTVEQQQTSQMPQATTRMPQLEDMEKGIEQRLEQRLDKKLEMMLEHKLEPIRQELTQLKIMMENFTTHINHALADLSTAHTQLSQRATALEREREQNRKKPTKCLSRETRMSETFHDQDSD